ncbi:AMP-binding enzyme [Desulfonema limicola]|uniref:AMP-binding enzyme n=1 Tax=Desulfonema limicola TaxID=45656 RepID=A0A975B775_9BACT|nr:aromatic amino acid ammonia-lyase [Desulfonema limicola]QTA80122.1 AMP-binding enzyme [Desulfonema limicola]
MKILDHAERGAAHSTASFKDSKDAVIISGRDLTVDDIVQVSRREKKAELTKDENIVSHVHQSRNTVLKSVEAGYPIYGVTTVFGGMAHILLKKEEAEELQNNMPWPHKTGAGKRLSDSSVRASMMLRANSLMRGVSGVRLEIIQRLVDCLNADMIPHVYDLGSIGASGDLVPLAYILGSVIGLGPEFKVNFRGMETDCLSALKSLNLPAVKLEAKESLAVMNGTSVMSGVAANCVYDLRALLALSLGSHALFIQGLRGTSQSFHPFIQQHKPHPGQILCAEQMINLLKGSQLAHNDHNTQHREEKHKLVQDRYSMRCIPQFLGPVIDGLAVITKQVEVEINSATDNPLIDPETDEYYYCGNFLGQYIAVGMDQLRYYISLLAKHLDVQIAMLVAPEFNNGLAPSLVGNESRRVNIGLKGLQISGNSIMPQLSFFGNSLADRFPTHAEQFNQNINSQGFGSANLARQSVDMFQQYMAICLMFGVQSVDLRTKIMLGHYDARKALSSATLPLYESILDVLDIKPSETKPYVFNDNEQALDLHIMKIAADIASGTRILNSVKQTMDSLKNHNPIGI